MLKRGLYLIFVCVFMLFLPISFAELISIDTSMSDVGALTAMESAEAGDIIEIAPGNYKFRVNFANAGTEENPIIIRALDPNNRPVWDFEGDDPADSPGTLTGGDRGRAAWQFRGSDWGDASHYTISDIVFTGAHMSSGDSAGIRLLGASDISVRNCIFEDNDNGIQGWGENILFEYCEFFNNGAPNIEGYSHNIYTHGGSFIFRYCHIHDPEDGQNFHMRTTNALLAYNLIENAGSYMGDLMTNTNTKERIKGEPITQTLTLLGNIIIEDGDTRNDGQIFVTYNDQEWPQTSFIFNIYYNTFIGDGNIDGLVHITDRSGTVNQEFYLYNNIFYGTPNPLRVDIDSGYTLVSENNWWQGTVSDYSDYSQYMSNSFFGSNPGFTDLNAEDYTLTSSAEVKNIADETIGNIPTQEYYGSGSTQMKYRARENTNDLGALESTTDTEILGYVPDNIPNPNCPALPPATGNTVTVSTATELRNAINNANVDDTILIEDGTYSVSGLQLSTSDITLRSVSGNRGDVILDGGYSSGSIFTLRANRITIADLTIQRAYYHGIHIQAGANYAKVYNVKFIDEREQFIKGNPSQDGGIYPESEALDYAEIACSYFELTDEGRPHINPTSGGCYTGGIDAHRTEGWIVRDNFFKNIYCTNGGLAEHTIHFWRTNKDSVVERNIIINPARGIGFGMANDGLEARDYPDFSYDDFSGTVDHIRGIIRNNIILGDTPGSPGFDGGIILWNSYGTEVYHNTVMSTTSQGSTIETRYQNTKDYLIKNNLLYKAPWHRDGQLGTVDNNYNSATSSMFRDMINGDLHLLNTATQAIDEGISISSINQDIDGEARDSSPDIGADEYSTSYTPPPCNPTTEICGNLYDEDCNGIKEQCLCSSIDTNKNNKIENSELNDYIEDWFDGSGTIEQLLDEIDKWKNDC
jgi:hypothetical protein